MRLLQVLDAESRQLMLEDDLGDVVMSFDNGYIGSTFIDRGNRVRLPTIRGTRILDATPIEDPTGSH